MTNVLIFCKEPKMAPINETMEKYVIIFTERCPAQFSI